MNAILDGFAKLACGFCGLVIEPGPCALDPRGPSPDRQQRCVHVACEAPFRARLAQARLVDEQLHRRSLERAAGQVWTAYLDYGPVDDGRPEGDAFAAALDQLMRAAVEAGVKMPKRKGRKRK